MQNYPTISPGLLYHNAPKMIEWLCKAFGFEKKLIVPGEGDKILHAHLVFGNGGIMLSSAEGYEYPDMCKSPMQAGGVNTVEIIVVVEGIEIHYDKAKAAGTEILIPLEDKPYGGKGYSCKDPEGNTWVFGSYNPWK